MFHKILQGSIALNLPHAVSLLHITTSGHYQIPCQELTLIKLSGFIFQPQLDYGHLRIRVYIC